MRHPVSPPLISVVMPVRNGGKLVRDAVQSILAQSERDLELIIIDDGSNDGALDGLIGSEARVFVTESAGRGIVDALNTGLRLARGPWVARMDADDIALPRRFERQLQVARSQPEIDVIGGRVEIFRDDGPLDGGYTRYATWINGLISPSAIRRDIYVECPVPHPTAMFHRDVFARVGEYRSGDFPEDYELMLRLNAAGISMAKPDATILRWRDRSDRTSRTDPRYATDRFTRLKAAFLSKDPRCAQGVSIWGAGPGGKALHDDLQAAGVKTHAFIDVHPRRIGNTVRGVRVYGVDELSAIESFVLVAVGAPGVRDEITNALIQSGRREESEFLFAM